MKQHSEMPRRKHVGRKSLIALATALVIFQPVLAHTELEPECVSEIVVLPGTELEIGFAPALPSKVRISTVNGLILSRSESGGEITSMVWRADDSYGRDYILVTDETTEELYLRIEVTVVPRTEFEQASSLEALPEEFQRILGSQYIIPTSLTGSLGDVLVLTKHGNRARQRCGPGLPPSKPKRCRGNTWSVNGSPERMSITREEVGRGTASQEIKVCGTFALELAKKLRRLGIGFTLDVNGCLTTTISGTAWNNVMVTSKYRFIRDTYCRRNGTPVLCRRRECFYEVRQYYLVFPALEIEIPVGLRYVDPAYCP
ncbi:MAG: hypothetical protein KatS3mg020_0234 [Fimbriimonadales bacterium]|nr:MAG: hypothetical protein KatS3mg019_1249 [Fimbriimonadales bacterium]GIV10743.1 MAG: hypothetical protein KatS3mg020_0234 [Fimbriimonadales bacterium]